MQFQTPVFSNQEGNEISNKYSQHNNITNDSEAHI